MNESASVSLNNMPEVQLRQAVIHRARELTRQYKLQGFHCSEATIRACSEAIGLHLPEDVLRCACGFRGGGGGYGDRCGVVEAGCMLISYLYGRLCPHQEVWPYSYLIRVLHERFAAHFCTLYCREIKTAEVQRDAEPICMRTYEDGAEIVTALLLGANELLRNVTEEEKLM